MKKTLMAGLAAIVGLVSLAGVATASQVEIDVLTMDLQADACFYEITLVPDVADPLVADDVLAVIETVPDGLADEAVTVSLHADPLATRGAAPSTMADGAMRLWSTRTAVAHTVSPDLLI